MTRSIKERQIVTELDLENLQDVIIKELDVLEINKEDSSESYKKGFNDALRLIQNVCGIQ